MMDDKCARVSAGRRIVCASVQVNANLEVANFK